MAEKDYLCSRIWDKRRVMTAFTRKSQVRPRKDRGVEQLVARQAHNLEVACSSPAPATH